MLAFIGSINDEILDKQELALEMICFLAKEYPETLKERYKLEMEGGVIDTMQAAEVLAQIAKVRGCLIKGGEPDYAKAANLLIDDFRSGKLGRLTLEKPPVDETAKPEA
jgi:ribosome biogenesis GTPase A